ncbi:MAG: sigma-70 family RNA polymerase sigma factor [Myxococcota bacterium]
MLNLIDFKKKPQSTEDFESLLEGQLDGMYRVALRYTRDPTRAEDLVHDTAVRALRFRDRFELGTNFRAWIYTVLTHTFFHRHRRLKREHEILDGVSREDVDRQLYSEKARQDSTNPENAYLENMLSDDVLSALDSLSEDFRVVVTLCDLEGLSYKEIADALDCPVGTVMSRLYRGRRILEKKLRHVAIERGILRDDAAGSSFEQNEQSTAADRQVLDMQTFRQRGLKA